MLGNNRKNHFKPSEGPIIVNHKVAIFPEAEAGKNS